MGIYIRGMEMPKTCGGCDLCAIIDIDDDLCTTGCRRLKKVVYDLDKRLPDCPLKEVETHGRLNVIEPYMQHDEDDGFDELIKPSDIDYMHTPSVEEIIKGDGE